MSWYGFPTSDVFTTQSLPTLRTPVQVVPVTSTSAHTHTRERHKFTVEGAPVSCLRSSSESSRIPSSQASGIFGWTVGNFFFLWTGTPGGTPKATSQRPVGSRTRGFVCVKTREENFHTSQVSHRLSSVRLSPEHSESSRPHMSQDHTCGGRTDTENHLNE